VRALSRILRERESKHEKGGKMEPSYLFLSRWKIEVWAPELRTMSNHEHRWKVTHNRQRKPCFMRGTN